MEQAVDAAQAKRIELAAMVAWLDEGVLPRLRQDYPECGDYVAKLRDELAAVLQTTSAAFEQAGALDKAAALAAGAVEVIRLLEPVRGDAGKLPGATKKGIAITVLMALYDRLDAGHDGQKDRIKLPWLPAAVSNGIERWALRFACDWGVEIGVAMLNRLTK